jgi:hypothetical protein
MLGSGQMKLHHLLAKASSSDRKPVLIRRGIDGEDVAYGELVQEAKEWVP